MRKIVEKIVRSIIPVTFDKKSARISSLIYRDLKKRNKIIEFRDIFIAAAAISENLCLATLNIKHFERIDDINLYEF